MSSSHLFCMKARRKGKESFPGLSPFPDLCNTSVTASGAPWLCMEYLLRARSCNRICRSVPLYPHWSQLGSMQAQVLLTWILLQDLILSDWHFIYRQSEQNSDFFLADLVCWYESYQSRLLSVVHVLSEPNPGMGMTTFFHSYGGIRALLFPPPMLSAGEQRFMTESQTWYHDNTCWKWSEPSKSRNLSIISTCLSACDIILSPWPCRLMGWLQNAKPNGKHFII